MASDLDIKTAERRYPIVRALRWTGCLEDRDAFMQWSGARWDPRDKELYGNGFGRIDEGDWAVKGPDGLVGFLDARDYGAFFKVPTPPPPDADLLAACEAVVERLCVVRGADPIVAGDPRAFAFRDEIKQLVLPAIANAKAAAGQEAKS